MNIEKLVIVLSYILIDRKYQVVIIKFLYIIHTYKGWLIDIINLIFTHHFYDKKTGLVIEIIRILKKKCKNAKIKIKVDLPRITILVRS